MMDGFARWLSDRLGWRRVTERLGAYRVPRHGFVFYVGSLTLFLFVVQVVTGILLMLYYQPDPATAFASVQRITGGDIPYGNLVHNVHAWAADLFVLMLFAHMFTVLVRRSFRPPHELSWISGIVSLVLGIGLAFTGAILPWNENAYADALIGSGLARNVPLVGDWLMKFMRGGDYVGASTLGHAFGFHVAALPAALTTLVTAHLFVLSRKPAEPPDPKAPTIPLYPDFFVRQAVAFTGITVILMTLATFADRPLGVVADPRAPPVGTRPPWYFLPFHQIIRAAPKELLGIDGARFIASAACLLGAVAVALPFIDTRGSKITVWFAWGLLLVLLLLSASALA
jgi:quinol-cytochrome oxidoreductase complex cytochrome b subunit